MIGLRLCPEASSVVGVDGLTLSWLLFLRVCPLGVWATYDRGVSAIQMFFPATGHGLPLVVIQTSVLSGMSDRSLTLSCLSKSLFCRC